MSMSRNSFSILDEMNHVHTISSNLINLIFNRF